MSMRAAHLIDAYFGPESGTAGPAATPPVPGSSIGASPTNATAPIITPGFYIPVPGVWTGYALTDWAVTAAGLFTYLGPVLGVGVVSYKANITPLGVGVNKKARMGISINGGVLTTAYSTEVVCDFDDPGFHTASTRGLFITGWTWQLQIANLSDVTDFFCDRVSMTFG